MMQVSFDLISDLHVETWSEPFDWTGMPTSMLAVVAGDISRDRSVVQQTLEHLAHCYKSVLYIDGNDEHRHNLHNLGASYYNLNEQIEKIPNVVYMHNNVAVIDGVAFVAANGWWTYDFDTPEVYDYSKQWFCDHYKETMDTANHIETVAMHDVSYLCNSVNRLQKHQDVKRIVVITHTVPSPILVQHDVELEGSHRLNCLGNSFIQKILSEDTENKITNWLFGHYHGDTDTLIDGIRYVNNCRGRGNTAYCKQVYNPKKIIVKF